MSSCFIVCGADLTFSLAFPIYSHNTDGGARVTPEGEKRGVEKGEMPKFGGGESEVDCKAKKHIQKLEDRRNFGKPKKVRGYRGLGEKKVGFLPEEKEWKYVHRRGNGKKTHIPRALHTGPPCMKTLDTAKYHTCTLARLPFKTRNFGHRFMRHPFSFLPKTRIALFPPPFPQSFNSLASSSSADLMNPA